MKLERVFAIKIAGLYPMYIRKVEAKNRTKEELDQVLCWLMGYTPKQLQKQIESDNDLAAFFEQAKKFNPKASLITGVVCGIRVENVEDPLMKKIRYMDKLVDELAKGKAIEKILRV